MKDDKTGQVRDLSKPFDVLSLYAWRHEPVGWRVVSDMYLLQ